MINNLNFKCSICGHRYDIKEITYTCPEDGGNLDILLDYGSIRENQSPDSINSSEPSLWRYLPLLPVSDPGGEQTPLRAAGWTPVYAPAWIKSKLRLSNLWIKDESSNPTASFKDRASAVVVARAKEIDADVIVTASTGNAGAALAGMAAAVGQKAVIIAPKTAPPAKIAQLLVFGAKVILVNGNYDDAFDLSIQASQEFGWYCRNTGYNPFTIEGKKTASFEIWEWMRTFEPAVSSSWEDLSVFVSVGDGNIISGIHKGFKDLLELGWIESVPRIFGVQSVGSAAVSNAFHAQTETIKPIRAVTLADSICVDLPRDGVRAVRAASQTGGSYITVRDDEILSAINTLGKNGIFAEPAGAASFAGLVKSIEKKLIRSDDPVLVINTGSGLKDINSAMKAAGEAPVIDPTLDDLKGVLDQIG